MLPKPWAGGRTFPLGILQAGSHLQPQVALGGREEWPELALPAKGGQRHHGAASGPNASKDRRGLGVLWASDPHVRPEAPCLQRLRVRGHLCCRYGGANIAAGTGGILEHSRAAVQTQVPGGQTLKPCSCRSPSAFGDARRGPGL